MRWGLWTLLLVTVFLIFGVATGYPKDSRPLSGSGKRDTLNMESRIIPDSSDLLDVEIPNGLNLYTYYNPGLNGFLKSGSNPIEGWSDGLDGFKPEDKSRKSTIVWGGFFPFISLPNGQNDKDGPGFFSKDNVSFFWFLKKRF